MQDMSKHVCLVCAAAAAVGVTDLARHPHSRGILKYGVIDPYDIHIAYKGSARPMLWYAMLLHLICGILCLQPLPEVL
jgi:hypothetical protein